MITASALGMPTAGWTDITGGFAAQDLPQLHAVWLIDRRSGNAHRVNGSPQVIHTNDPAAARAELLRGRDPEVWKAVAYPLGQGVEP